MTKNSKDKGLEIYLIVDLTGLTKQEIENCYITCFNNEYVNF